MNFIGNIVQRSKEEVSARQYQRGWDFASGKYMESDDRETSIFLLETLVSERKEAGKYTSFDKAIEDLIKRAKEDMRSASIAKI